MRRYCLSRFTSRSTRFQGYFDYSPDGRYIIAVTQPGVLTVVDLATGEEIPVRLPQLGHGLLAPAWKPEPNKRGNRAVRPFFLPFCTGRRYLR